MTDSPATKQRARAVLGHVLAVLGILLAFLTSLVVSAALHVNHPGARRLALRAIDAAAADGLRGRVTVAGLDELRLHRARIRSVTVFDVEGRRVIRADHVDVRLAPLTLVRSLLSGPLRVRVPELSVASGEVVLLEEEAGLSLARAFEPTAPPIASGGGPSLELELERVLVERLALRGTTAAVPALHVDVRGLRGAVRYADRVTAIELATASVVARQLPAVDTLRGQLRGGSRISTEAPRVRGDFRGSIAGVPAWLAGSYSPERVRADVTLGPAPPDALSRLLPGVDFRDPATLQLSVAGTPRDLSAEGAATLGRGHVALRARGRLEPEPRAEATLDVSDLSLASFGRSLPETRLNAHARTECRVSGGRFSGEYALSMPAGRVERQLVPRIDARGTYSDGAATARLQVHEPGAPIDVELDFHAPRSTERGVEPGRLELRAEGRAEELARVARLAGAPARGRLEFDARGRMTLSDPVQVDAELRASLARVAWGASGAGGGRLEARASGAWPDALLEVKGDLNDVAIGQYRFERAELEIDGSARDARARFTARGAPASSIALEALLDAGAGAARNVEASVRRAGDAARLTARRVELVEGGVEIEGLTLRGPGLVQLDARLGSLDDRVESRGRALDLARLSALAGVAGPIQSGRLSYDLIWRQERGEVRGRVAAQLDELTLRELQSASATVDLGIAGNVVDGAIRARAGDLLVADARLDHVELPRSPERLEDLARLVGNVDLRARVDLAKLAEHVPIEVLPVQRAEGRLAFELRVRRSDPEALPELETRLVTERVRLVGKPAAAGEPGSGLRWQVAGIDANVGLRIGDGGATALDARLFDGRGEWLRVAARTALPRRLTAVPAALREYRALAVELEAAIPERELATLPDVLRQGALGRIQAKLEARGTVGDPELELLVRGKCLRSGATGAIPLDLEGRVRHRGGRGEAHVEVLERGRKAAWLDGTAELDLAGLLAGEPASTPRGSLRAGADRFPLAALVALGDRQIVGHASGELELTDLGRAASLTTRVRVQDFGVGEVRFDEARAELRAGAERAVFDTRVSSRDGSADLHLDVPITWGARAIPVADPARTGRARFRAENLRAAALMPLVDDTLSALDGRIDGSLDATLDRERSELRGQVKLRDGVVQIPALGQELSDVDLSLQAEPGGKVRLERLTARGATGRLEASGVAQLHGLSLREANLRAHVPRGHELPLTLEGVSYGDAYGDAEIRVVQAPGENTLHVQVELPSLTVLLPDKTQHQIQSLDDDPRIRTGVYLSRENFAALPLERSPESVGEDAQPNRIVTRIRLGKDVWVRQGTTLRVRLTGMLKLTSAEDLSVDGEIKLRSGRLDVQGKEFVVEDGTVTFNGEPDDPTIVATGVWQSPDAYRVYASFTGPLKSGNFRLRSDPPLQESEILSLLLFGAPDGQLGASLGRDDPSTAATAISVGGTTATKGLNRALAELTSLDVQTRIDTGSGTATPEIAVQISRRLSAEIGYNMGDPGPGQAPDRTFLSLDWRIRDRWLLSTTFGDRGSSLWDVLWQYRF